MNKNELQRKNKKRLDIEMVVTNTRLLSKKYTTQNLIGGIQ